jgi:hypothetical protein
VQSATRYDIGIRSSTSSAHVFQLKATSFRYPIRSAHLVIDRRRRLLATHFEHRRIVHEKIMPSALLRVGILEFLTIHTEDAHPDSSRGVLRIR